MDLSIVIVNYNVEHFLEQCLNSTIIACEGLETEIWVVDNNSIDGSVEMVRDKFPNVKLIANKDNVGFSKANNQAMEQSSGRYILLLNPDTVVQEDTFVKTVQFMDENPDGGGLGVKMVDGKGVFLPESKRGLPTPSVAFYKIFGLSRLFPKSKRFGKYHLGYLDDHKTHPIEILSGAFMFMRTSVLKKIGYLDEDFFMYGEDIDLSYRIIKAGHKNYYYPDTRIIHYKGESTKKSSVNYVFVFYNAMIIFARKHFSQKNAKAFSILINIAIYFRAGVAILNRVIKRSLVPFLDLTLAIAILYGLSYIYQGQTSIEFPKDIIRYALPSYALVWSLSIYLSGGYDRPFKWIQFLRGLLIGTLVILATYALLDKSYQFSRVYILLGAIGVTLGLSALRFLFSAFKLSGYRWRASSNTKFAIVGSLDECNRVSHLLNQTHPKIEFLASISPKGVEQSVNTEFKGSWNQINQFVHIHKIDELIFCAKDVSAADTIGVMSSLDSDQLDFKIAQPESLFLIGSNSIETSGDLYMLDVNSINKPRNKRNKRLFDFTSSFLLCITSPIGIWFTNQKIGFIKNIFQVLIGRKTWIGYDKSSTINLQLPKIKPNILNLSDTILQHSADKVSLDRLNIIYAKDYSIKNDLKLLIKAFSKTGKSV